MEGTIATVSLYAGNFAPKSWAFCAAQILPIAQNTALYALIGTTYGGDGRTTFALPDLRGRAAIGAGQAPGMTASYTLGEMTGTPNTTLTQAQLPVHTHVPVLTVKLPVDGNGSGAETPEGAFPGVTNGNVYAETPGSQQFTGPFHTVASVGFQGSSQPMNNLQPYLGMNYIICLYGIFPARN